MTFDTDATAMPVEHQMRMTEPVPATAGRPACSDEHLVAMYINLLHDMRAELAALADTEPTPEHLTAVFAEELQRAQRFSLLPTMRHPALATRVSERVLASTELSRQRSATWTPILCRYAQAGVIVADIDMQAAVRWLTHQHFWLLVYPGMLAADPVARDAYIRDFVVKPLLADKRFSQS